jgi:Holliday junction resolvase
MKEQVLVNQVLAYLKLKGHYAWRVNTGAMYSKDNRFVRFGFKGVSDIVGINGHDSKFIAIECKVGKNKPTQFQEDFLAEI